MSAVMHQRRPYSPEIYADAAAVHSERRN